MDLPKRKQNRLPEYDYTQPGAYFVTLCTKQRKNLFWDENHVGADMIRPPLSEYGKTVENTILSIPDRYPGVRVDKYVVMPDHVHLILCLGDPDGRMISAPTSVSTVIGMMKRCVSRQIGRPIWQKSFHDHVIRNETDYMEVWAYMDGNPARWAENPRHNL